MDEGASDETCKMVVIDSSFAADDARRLFLVRRGIAVSTFGGEGNDCCSGGGKIIIFHYTCESGAYQGGHGGVVLFWGAGVCVCKRRA
jgi:hypothetical protein